MNSRECTYIVNTMINFDYLEKKTQFNLNNYYRLQMSLGLHCQHHGLIWVNQRLIIINQC